MLLLLTRKSVLGKREQEICFKYIQIISSAHKMHTQKKNMLKWTLQTSPLQMHEC